MNTSGVFRIAGFVCILLGTAAPAHAIWGEVLLGTAEGYAVGYRTSGRARGLKFLQRSSTAPALAAHFQENLRKYDDMLVSLGAAAGSFGIIEPDAFACVSLCGGFGENAELQAHAAISGGQTPAAAFASLKKSCDRGRVLFTTFTVRKTPSGNEQTTLVRSTEQNVCASSLYLAEKVTQPLPTSSSIVAGAEHRLERSGTADDATGPKSIDHKTDVTLPLGSGDEDRADAYISTRRPVH